MDEHKENTQCEHCKQQMDTPFVGRIPFAEAGHTARQLEHHEAVWSAYHRCRDEWQLFDRDAG